MSGYTVAIEGMHCANCVKRVTGALEGLEGARDVAVDLEAKRANLCTDAGADRIREAVEDLGFEVVSIDVL